MNQKPDHFSKKYRRSRTTEGQSFSPVRRIILSSEDSKKLDAESSRARLIQHRTNPDKSLPKDFAAYFHCNSIENRDPAYVVTSHHTRDPLPKRRSVISTYPCIQSLRWNPYVETSSIEEEPEIPEPLPSLRPGLNPDLRPDYSYEMRSLESKFHCRCKSCDITQCPSRVQSASVSDGHPAFKDNIMKFTDQHTMTPRLNEVGCGCDPIYSKRVSDVSVAASDIAVKDTQASMQIHRLYHPEKCTTPIIKRNENNNVDYPSMQEHSSYEEYPNYSTDHCCEHASHPPMSCNQEPERDFGEDYIKPPKISPIKSFFGCNKKKNTCKPRRIIYNEGISDKVADHFPITPVRVPSPINLARDCSKTNWSKCCPDEGIPFSHRSDSKYHHNCNKPNHGRSFYGDVNERRHIVNNPEVFRKTYASQPLKCLKIPTIQMPKKVLTSEQDIESYIERGCPKVVLPAARKQRRN